MAKPGNKKKAPQLSSSLPCCNLPTIPDRHLSNSISPNREFLIRYIEKKWVIIRHFIIIF